MNQMHIGTSGWSYPHWKGPFYPADLAEGGQLDFYVQHFDNDENGYAAKNALQLQNQLRK